MTDRPHSGDAGTQRMFPIQKSYVYSLGTRVGPDEIPWADAEIAYRAYSAMNGTQQSLERLAERKGFGWTEYLALRATASAGVVSNRRDLWQIYNAALRQAQDEIEAAHG